MPTVTETRLHICSKSRALRVMHEPLAGGQLRLATDGAAWCGSFALALTGLIRDVCTEGPLSVVAVAVPPHPTFEAWRVYTGDVAGIASSPRGDVLLFADGTEVPVADVLAVTI